MSEQLNERINQFEKWVQGSAVHAPRATEEETLSLMVAMTESAFAHEYGLMALNSTKDYMEKETISLELESFRVRYFEARELLAQLSPEKLLEVELEIQDQKNAVFEPENIIH